MTSAFELAARAGDDADRGDAVAASIDRARADTHSAILHVDAAAKTTATRGRLVGVPVVVKDNLCVTGTPTTCASRVLEGWVAPYDAHVVERLRAEGAVIVGKANLDEFAMGSTGETSAFGATANPLDPSRVPGGSSSGSAAAVAAGIVPLALGSDTGGSVRQPAAFCGLVGLKPTYGRVSRYGLVAYASSLDQVGPIARDARDCALALSVIAGHDPRDATSVDVAREDGANDEWVAAVSRGVRGLRIGVPRAFLEGADPDVRAAFDEGLRALVDAGATLVDVELPHVKLGVSVYYLVATAEASSNLARFDGVRFGVRVSGKDLVETYERTRALFGAEVKRRILLGTYALSAGYYDAYYVRAQKVRTHIREDFARAFERCDVIATPTAPSVAWKLGETPTDPVALWLQDLYTLPASLAGLPALSAPCGLGAHGMPVGFHVTGRAFDEATILAVAGALESGLSGAASVGSVPVGSVPVGSVSGGGR
ncbi:MAG: Asp-tRNA(Asn)/Glu-tRNA(Gln) amidotransferase subunit GatA [Myxococcota bacterium]|jgi:aspartyl-tRNA(Asn)/glutamyl-tRNA(Gln) amidotransferase subunit A|nr:Asp-tRNA(Asn)/Glu-tRNA(Gln) amidotransferase subunit GatA [Myxococcota bacterium]